jgi:hypothetical protein
VRAICFEEGGGLGALRGSNRVAEKAKPFCPQEVGVWLLKIRVVPAPTRYAPACVWYADFK